MGEWSGFFPSSGGDRKYKTAHIAAITDALFHSGVCQNDDLTLAPAGAMTAALGAGRALVNGYHYQNDSPLNLTFGYADGTLARIDAVMLRRDVNSRDIHAVVIPGTPAINPTAPACTRDADAYDLCLYHVRIPAGATAITASMITDRRADADLCGYVYCKFAGIGTSVMQAAVDEMISAVSSELNQLNAGTAVMTKAQYDPNGSGVDVTAQIYKCTKSGKVYALTGHGGFGRFKVPAAWASGDTWTVNGKSVPAYCGADLVDGDTIVAGRWVLFSYDGTQLNFSGGGGLSLGKLAQATAKPGQVLAGVPYYAGNKMLKKGTMPDRGQNQYGGSVEAGTDYIAIRDLPDGYYHADDAKNAPEARAKMTEFGTAGKDELMAGYTMTSKEGLRIGGTLILSGNADTSDVLSGKEFYTNDPKTKKRGTLALSGSATAADVLAGKTFYNTDAKSKQGGQMADNGDWGTTLAPGGAIAVPPGKHSGNGVVRARGVVFSDFSSIIRSAAQGSHPAKPTSARTSIYLASPTQICTTIPATAQATPAKCGQSGLKIRTPSACLRTTARILTSPITMSNCNHGRWNK